MGIPYVYCILYLKGKNNEAKNIWQFQRLAKQLGTRVVELFATDFMFRINELAPNFNQSSWFSDYFDLEKCNKMVVQHDGSPSVKWEKFLFYAPCEFKAVVLYN